MAYGKWTKGYRSNIDDHRRDYHRVTCHMVTSFTSNWTMSTTVDVQQPDPIPIQQGPKPPKKLKPARKQVKAGDVVKTEAVQTGKEYSAWKHTSATKV